MSIFDERWRIKSSGQYLVVTDETAEGLDNIVCDAPGYCPECEGADDAAEPGENWPARSRLIVAAPDLVAALRLVRRFIPGAYEGDLAIVDAALTKAGVFS